MKLKLFRTMAAAALLAVNVLSTPCPEAQAVETVRINGSGNALDMLKPLITAYRKLHPGTTIEMDKPLGSSGAIKALLAGSLDITASSKTLNGEETAKGAVASEYGKTPLVIVTESGVKKKDISTKELEDIYAGKTRTWSDGSQIRIILRPEADIDTTILRGLSSGMNQAISIARSHPGMTVAVTDPESSSMISRTPGAIGAAALAGIIIEKKPLNPLTLNGIQGTTKNLANGTYPLAKDIRFITTAKTPPAARKFLEFVYSPQGRAIAAKAGVLVTNTASFNK